MKILKDDSNELLIKESGFPQRIMSAIILVLAILIFFTPILDVDLIDPMPMILLIIIFIPLILSIIVITDDTILVNKSAKIITITRKNFFRRFKQLVRFEDLKCIKLKGPLTPETDSKYKLGYTDKADKFNLIMSRTHEISRLSVIDILISIQAVQMGQAIASAIQIPFVTEPHIPGTSNHA